MNIRFRRFFERIDFPLRLRIFAQRLGFVGLVWLAAQGAYGILFMHLPRPPVLFIIGAVVGTLIYAMSREFEHDVPVVSRRV